MWNTWIGWTDHTPLCTGQKFGLTPSSNRPMYADPNYVILYMYIYHIEDLINSTYEHLRCSEYVSNLVSTSKRYNNVFFLLPSDVLVNWMFQEFSAYPMYKTAMGYRVSGSGPPQQLPQLRLLQLRQQKQVLRVWPPWYPHGIPMVSQWCLMVFDGV